ncbi:hypothetical protein [Streptomyces sp. NPDC026673]|uniref:hypothetical protein n=1 Tax=Streptomyces sp. NPDC026673 TaxID=3155724 RepID=UPI00340A72F8
MSPATALPTTTRPAHPPTTHQAVPPQGSRTAPHRLGILGIVWILGNSAALPLLWTQVTTAQHSSAPTAASTPDDTPSAA